MNAITRKIIFFLLVFHSSLITHHSSPVYAQAPPPPDSKIQLGRFNFGVAVGYYQPDLSSFNEVISDRTQAILQDPNYLLPGNPNFTVEERNIEIEKIGGAPWLGLEAQWEMSQSFALRLTGGVWRGERISSDIISTFLRSNLPQIQVPRSARYNLILDQIFLEWRYFFVNDPKGARLSLDLGILGMTVGFLTMDSLVKVIHPAAPNGGFASISSTEAMGTAYTSRYGLTGEYQFGKKFSLALSAYYVLGRMTDLEVKRYFAAGFPDVPVPEPLSIRTGTPLPSIPPTPNVGERVTTATSVTDPFTRQDIIGFPKLLKLELDGLQVSGYLRFYF